MQTKLLINQLSRQQTEITCLSGETKFNPEMLLTSAIALYFALFTF